MSPTSRSLAGLTSTTQQLTRGVQVRSPADEFVPFEENEINCTIFERFELQVRKHPERIALKLQDRTVTYSELNQIANRIGRAVLSQSAGTSSPVGLLFEKNASMFAAMLGVLKAGRSYVPLDPAHPHQRLQSLLDDAGVELVVTDDRCRALGEGLAHSAAHLLNIDETGSHFSTDNLGLTVASDAPCYIIYTSGSTGQPKGVVQGHRNVLHNIRWHTNSLRLGARDRFTLLASCAAGQSVTDIYAALLNGATLYPFDIRKEGFADLRTLLIDEEITVYHSSASVFAYFVDSLKGEEEFPKLRYVKLGGESVTKREVEMYKRHFPVECRLVNTLSSTEAGTIRQNVIDQDTIFEGNIVPVGYPVDNKDIFLLNEAGEEAGFEEVGEIYVDSAYLAIEYWRKPDATSAVFKPSPAGNGRRVYRSGDVGRLDRQNRLIYLGRKDSRVKISGHTIELAEVEAALASITGIADVAVAAREQRGELRLVAYIVAKRDVDLSTSAIRKLLAEKLPAHMIPASFVKLNALPRTPNGKVAREELPEPPASRPHLDSAFVAPRGPVEQALAQTCSEVLGIAEVGVNDNFFDLGGNSLMAARAASRLEKVLDVEIPMRLFFENPTVRGLAEAVVRSKEAKKNQAVLSNSHILRPGSSVENTTAGVPLSFPQERLWFLSQLDPASPAYNICRAVHIRGELNFNALRDALDDLVGRHQPLRTVFRWVGDAPTQEVRTDVKLDVRSVDLTDFKGTEQKEDIWNLLRTESRRAFDLSNDLPIRATVFRCNDQECWLLLVIHHIATDGWSMGVLFEELADLYASHATGNPCRLTPLSVQYTDFAHWQRDRMRGGTLEEDLRYWTNRLAGAPPFLSLPFARPRPDRPSLAGSSESIVFPAALTDSLRALSRQTGASLFMILLAGLQALLQRYTGETDICVGTAIANRSKVELEPLIGFFVNTLVLRTDLSGNLNFRELLQRVRDVALDAYAHQDLPFEKLVEAIHPERSLQHSPLFQLMLILNNTPCKTLRLPGLDTQDFKLENGTAKFDLTLSFNDAAPEIKGQLEYSTDLFDAETIRRMLGHYQSLLEAAVANPEQSIATLPILTAEERRQVLIEWNDTKKEYPAQCVHRVFESQVERTPDAIAVLDENIRLTYRELNRQANQVAHQLLSMGVGSETPVGVCLERSAQTFVVLLGILKAGAPYVPLDPTYPKERLIFMSQDSGATLLVTQSNLAEQLSGTFANVLCLDRDGAAIVAQDAENPVQKIGAPSLIYTMYTSGSTGMPKGVMATHAATMNRLHWMWGKYPFGPDEINCQKTALSFVDSVWEIFGALLKGVPTVVIPDQVAQDPRALVQTIARNRVTRLVAVPSLLEAILEALTDVAGRLTCLRYCISSGETLSSSLANRFTARLPECTLLNLYGSTEVAGDATCYEVVNDSGVYSAPIGRPIDNTQAYILDRYLQPTPIGVSAELYVAGEGVARGYRNQPELTADKFLPNPFCRESDVRLYKTGDLARFRSDGNIEFLGRGDDQVKIRGFRVELGEIEAALAKHPALKAAAVVCREEAPGDKRLVAYATLRGSSPPKAEELRNFLKSKLPEYMLPWKFEFMPGLPMTASGKVDRHRLPAPRSSMPEKSAEFEAPRTELEKKLAQTWAEVLKVDRVGIHDNFFDLGGYSLLAVKLIKEIEKISARRISLASLFRAPTISDLAVVLAGPDPSEEVPGVIPIQPHGARPPFICMGTSDITGPVYRPLALRLGLDQPFLCLNAVEADIETLAAPFLLEDIAAGVVRKLLSVQPHGPYFIGGWCGPGLLAYEVAQQLRARGETVALLVLFDTFNLSRRRENSQSTTLRAQSNRGGRKIKLYFDKLAKLTWKERFVDFAAVWNFREKKIRHQLWRSYYKLHLAIFGRFGSAFRKFFDAGYVSVAIRNYVPIPYSGPVTIIWSTSEPEPDVQDREMHWRGLVDAAEVHYVPGRHREIFFEPNVEILAKKLEGCLSKAQEKYKPAT